MSELKLKPCPMCGCRAEFDYGAPMNSGKRIVKVKCCIGCVEQNIFRCDEADAALAWNCRAQPEANADAKDAITDTERLNFVLENGVPMMRGGEYRFHGFPGKWFKTDREAIDVAVNAARQAKEKGND